MKTNKKNPRFFLTILVLVTILVVIGFCFHKINFQENIIIVKLVNATSWGYVESAGYYGGILDFVDIKTSKNYSINPCSKDWSWVKEGSCYEINLREVNQNIESHKYSMMLSGCYVGTLNQTSC
jgi:hypothetical protein